MIPTYEQIDIVKSIQKEECLKVKAFAGAAKTTTLQIAANTYKNKKILYLAYNNSIQKEAEIKFHGLAMVKTFHSFGLGYIKKSMININIRNQDYKAVEIRELLGIDYNLAKDVLEIFKKFCNSDLSLSDFILKNKNVVSENMAILYKKISKGEFYCTHDAYLKMFQILLLNNTIAIDYDILMTDEAQDLNDVKIFIFNAIQAKRKILVGDGHQQVYNFTGSVDAMEKIHGKTLYLTETFRFDSKIANRANLLLNRFKNEKLSIKTNVNNQHMEINTKAYISRTNITLVSELARLYREGRSDFKTIKNPDSLLLLPEELFYFIFNQKEKIRTNRYLLNFKSISDLEDYIDNGDDRELIRAKDIIYEYKDEILNIKEYAKQQFLKTEGINYYLTTAHTSKGLEFDEVILANDFPHASELIAKAGYDCLEEFIDNLDFVDRKYLEEFNLLYVAITRAKKHLNETDCDAMNYLDFDIARINIETRLIYEAIQKSRKGGRIL